MLAHLRCPQQQVGGRLRTFVAYGSITLRRFSSDELSVAASGAAAVMMRPVAEGEIRAKE